MIVFLFNRKPSKRYERRLNSQPGEKGELSYLSVKPIPLSVPRYSYFDQSQETKTAQWTNQNLNYLQPTRAQETECMQLTIGFGFASHWLRN